MNVHASLAPRPRVVAFVPAKGSSERIANKNLQVLDGDHLFRRKLRQLVACSAIDTVYLDTESDEIAELAADLPVKHLKRPKNLADNSCDGHALFAWECANAESADLYVQVLCTAPFVTADTVGRAIQRMIDDPEADSLVGVASARQYCWAGGEPVYGRGRIPNSVELDPTVVEAMSLYIVRRREGEEPPEPMRGPDWNEARRATARKQEWRRGRDTNIKWRD